MAQNPKADEPAYPVADAQGWLAGGMTKREMMALGCMRTAAALHPDETLPYIAVTAVKLADELLDALDG